MEEKGQFRTQVTQYRKDGSRLDVDTTVWVIRGPDGRMQGVTCISRDMTGVRHFEDRLKDILDCLPDAVIVVDKDRTVVYISRAMETVYKRKVTVPVSLDTLRDCMYQPYRSGTDIPYPFEDSPIRRALRGETITADDIDLDIYDERVLVEITAAPILDQHGDVEYAVAVTKGLPARRAGKA